MNFIYLEVMKNHIEEDIANGIGNFVVSTLMGSPKNVPQFSLFVSQISDFAERIMRALLFSLFLFFDYFNQQLFTILNKVLIELILPANSS